MLMLSLSLVFLISPSAQAGDRDSSTADLRLTGSTDYSGTGSAIATGDFDGDGNADLVVGQPPAEGWNDA
jgi:hypothetical protein